MQMLRTYSTVTLPQLESNGQVFGVFTVCLADIYCKSRGRGKKSYPIHSAGLNEDVLGASDIQRKGAKMAFR